MFGLLFRVLSKVMIALLVFSASEISSLGGIPLWAKVLGTGPEQPAQLVQPRTRPQSGLKALSNHSSIELAKIRVKLPFSLTAPIFLPLTRFETACGD